MALARRSSSAWSRPTQTVCAADSLTVRPVSWVACEPGRTLGADAADDDRRIGPLDRLGQRGRVDEPVVAAVVGERLLGRPEPLDDLDLLLEAAEPLPRRRERDAVGGVLGVEPARADAQLDPAAAHLVHLGDADRQRARQPERGRAHQGAEPDRGRLPGQPRQGDPGVGGAGARVALPDALVVVGPEERVEPQALGGLGHDEEFVVGGPLLGLGEEPQFHDAIIRP
jgi:hypothetical protein